MIEVDGIILVLSCHKHLDTRLKHLKLPKDNYENWKVIYVIGDLFLDSDYKLEGNFMTIKCEDSYIHLLKKLVLALKYIYENFNIKEGVLRCGDDLIFNEELLQSFLVSPKKRKIYDNNNDICENIDFLGRSPSGKSLLSHEISDADIKTTINDNFMVDYYICHPEDFDNPLYNLKGVDISKYTKRPHIPVGPCGIMYYISNKSCNILINHLNDIKFNIFHYDEYTDSYPYTIEDCAVSYILYYNKISFIHWVNMYHDYPYNNNDVLAIHTNMNK
jgi:hypothetical protein